MPPRRVVGPGAMGEPTAVEPSDPLPEGGGSGEGKGGDSPGPPDPEPAWDLVELEVQDGGERLDVYLARALDISRNRASSLLKDGRVRLDGRVPRKAEAVEAGQTLRVEIPPVEAPRAEPEPIPLDIVHEDRDIVVVSKAPGLVVHPAPGHPTGTLVNALLHHVEDLSGIGGELRPGIVHRLDRDTSGLLVVAKSDDAHRTLAAALERRDIRRFYLAASWGHLDRSPLEVDAPVGRHPRDRKRMAVVEGGRRAVTRFRVRERWRSAELLEVAMETGRTHQIRVHLAHVGHPVVGDETYGARWERGVAGPDRGWAQAFARRVPRQFLHAWRLAFPHPRSGRELRFEAPLPEDLQRAVDWVRENP